MRLFRKLTKEEKTLKELKNYRLNTPIKHKRINVRELLKLKDYEYSEIDCINDRCIIYDTKKIDLLNFTWILFMMILYRTAKPIFLKKLETKVVGGQI